ncbi:hypothetical protein [Salmonella enterica]
MEFSAGLMPLETALTQMLSRITPLTAVDLLASTAIVLLHPADSTN